MRPRCFPDLHYSSLPVIVKQEFAHAAETYTVTIRLILSSSHAANVSAARLQVMRFLRDRGYSYPQIGKVFRMHHTSVMHALKRHPKPETPREPAPFPDYSGEWAI